MEKPGSIVFLTGTYSQPWGPQLHHWLLCVIERDNRSTSKAGLTT